eukprot:gnl/TRDRNA2_/TRDRNA2_33296_c0_seq1.p1 gnl/TRDRNA2_/TRDRNA2_33296_c0~~gnl/TRDRNA2_/TRDRNA2_33296_c0_seq1.p1  ORF type:complete len:285 (+),score=37.17 gnl/TRDRNA2_/TRDRNA2_33296_c0_seq1:59-913(+)
MPSAAPFPQAWHQAHDSEAEPEDVAIRRRLQAATSQALEAQKGDIVTFTRSLRELEDALLPAQVELTRKRNEVALMTMLRDAIANGHMPSSDDVAAALQACSLSNGDSSDKGSEHDGEEMSRVTVEGTTASCNGTPAPLEFNSAESAKSLRQRNRCSICTLPLPCAKHNQSQEKTEVKTRKSLAESFCQIHPEDPSALERAPAADVCSDTGNPAFSTTEDISTRGRNDNHEGEPSSFTAKDVDLVISQVCCSREQAIAALRANNSDVLEAILALAESGSKDKCS